MLPPIVKHLSPSPEQEPAITCRGCDVVVTAGAGTGKTRTLVARYLALLSKGLPLRSIVAITFTQKAAREMRNRLREAIRTYLESRELSGTERQLWGQHYSDLDGARVSTIHSLCTDILRAHPAEAGVDPGFEVLDEGTSLILRAQAIQEGLAWAADQPEVVGLFELLDERGLAQTLSELLARRLEVEQLWASLPADLLAHWQKVLAAQQAQACERLLADEGWRAWVDILQSHQATNPNDLIEQQRQLALAALDPATGTLAGLADLKLTGGSAKSWPGGKAELEEVKMALKGLRALYQASAPLLALTLTELDRVLIEATPPLRQLFNFTRERYTRLKGERTSLDFDDLEDLTLAVLRENEAVRRRWQGEIRALLVDEFQDTNARQRDLLDYLNGEGGKLFIVGDAKQSIYRFRNADVVVFREKRRQIETQGGQHIPLARSYRAHQALLEGMNALLAPVLGPAADPTRPWLEPFAPLDPDRRYAGQGFEPPHIELHLTVGSKGEGALERAAEALVNRLISLVEEEELFVGVGPRARPLSYGDIALLCRASTSFGPYENALERAGIPFLTVAGRGFYQRPEIRDLLNALQALAEPNDDLALAGLLRSPALGLSDEALYHLRRVGKPGVNSLWDSLKSGEAALGAADRERTGRAVALIEALQPQVGRIAAAELLKQFLDLTDYRAALIRAGQERSARNVSKLLTDATVSNLVSVGELLAYVNNLRDSGSREGEARATAEGVVQLMSIHAAKGLEFPVVALGDLGYEATSRRSVLLDPRLGVLLPQKDEDKRLSGSYTLARLQAQDQEEAESRRLLYVAVTRAQEKVLLSGCLGLKDDGTPSSRARSWLGELIGPALLGLSQQPLPYNPEGKNIIELGLQVGETPVSCHIYEPGCEPKRSTRLVEPEPDWPTPLPPAFLSPLVPPQVVAPEPPQRIWRVMPQAASPHAPAWLVSRLTHKALAAWRFPGPDFEGWLATQARNYGLTDEYQLREVVEQSRRRLTGFQSHSLYEVMNGASRRLHNVPYSFLLNGALQSGSIDALFLQDNIWTVVDFITDRIWNEAERNRLLSTTPALTQIQQHQQIVAQMLNQEPQVILCWLDYAGEVRLQTEFALSFT